MERRPHFGFSQPSGVSDTGSLEVGWVPGAPGQPVHSLPSNTTWVPREEGHLFRNAVAVRGVT